MKNSHSVDIPLLFFSFAFSMVLFGIFSKLLFSNKPVAKTTQTQTPLPQVDKKINMPKINYNQPILCEYQTKESTISAAIDMNSIAVTLLYTKYTQKHVVVGDCIYSWIAQNIQGNKKCGIGNTLSIGRQLLDSGLISLDSLSDMIPKSEQKGIDITAAILSCKNVKEIKKEVFVVPKSVIFK